LGVGLPLAPAGNGGGYLHMERKMEKKLLMIICLFCLIVPLIILGFGIYTSLQPDVITTVHHAAPAAYDTQEHSHNDGIFLFGVALVGIGVLFAWLIAEEIGN